MRAQFIQFYHSVLRTNISRSMIQIQVMQDQTEMEPFPSDSGSQSVTGLAHIGINHHKHLLYSQVSVNMIKCRRSPVSKTKDLCSQYKGSQIRTSQYCIHPGLEPVPAETGQWYGTCWTGHQFQG